MGKMRITSMKMTEEAIDELDRFSNMLIVPRSLLIREAVDLYLRILTLVVEGSEEKKPIYFDICKEAMKTASTINRRFYFSRKIRTRPTPKTKVKGKLSIIKTKRIRLYNMGVA